MTTKHPMAFKFFRKKLKALFASYAAVYAPGSDKRYVSSLTMASSLMLSDAETPNSNALFADIIAAAVYSIMPENCQWRVQ
jgi:hypothetical protein